MSSKYIWGVKIVSEDLGKGKPIVFIHRQPFNRGMWKYQSKAFENAYRLINNSGSERIRRQPNHRKNSVP
jgi:hypothetical protein